MREWCGGKETQVCSLVRCLGKVVTTLNTYTVMTITAVCRGFTLAYVFLLVIRLSLNYTGRGHGLSLELHMFLLFLTEHSFPRGLFGL